MQATLACNSTIQLWLTPVRDMAIFFCYVYLVVDSVIQLSGIATIYTAFFSQWEYWYVLVGIIAGCGFTYFTFALRKWRYKTMTAIGFALAIVYLGYFYFFIDYGVEKEMLFIPLFFRGAASVIISIVFLTSIVQSGLPFQVFPQALTINGFTGAVMGATLGPAIIGELLRHTMAKNALLLGANITSANPDITLGSLGQIYGMVQTQALIVSMKEIYGWLLIAALTSLIAILLSYSSVRPFAIFPKWSTIRRLIRRVALKD